MDSLEYLKRYFGFDDDNLSKFMEGIDDIISDHTLIDASQMHQAQLVKLRCNECGIVPKNNSASKKNGKKLSNDKQRSNKQTFIYITRNESKNTNLLDYLLLSKFMDSQRHTALINLQCHASHNSPCRKKSKDKNSDQASKEQNKLLLLLAICVLFHCAVCVFYHEHCKKQAGKHNKRIDYLADWQYKLAMFQGIVTIVSLAGAGMFIEQDVLFLPFLVNAFVCGFSSYLFYHEYNNTIEKNKPYEILTGILTCEARSYGKTKDS